MEHPKAINSFRDDFFFLSNMYPTPINYNGNQYNSSEAAFQAAKCRNPEDMAQFLTLEAHKAKKVGRRVLLRQDWEDVKIEIMEQILREKFSNEELKKLLIDTYPSELIEGNTWNDTFWGVDIKTGKGQNNLGKLLMKIRDEMRPKIVVLGGCFNPPTKAHTALLNTAVKSVDAEFGIFVPSSDKYVSRKMSKAKSKGEPSQVFSEEDRLAMLQAICRTNTRLRVDTCEYGDDGRGHTYDTLVSIQKKYPKHKVLFVIGADNLHITPKWNHHSALFEEFNFLVIFRNGIDAETIVNTHPVLSQYRSIFYFMPALEEYSHISSTAIRKAMVQGLDFSDMINDEVIDVLRSLKI